MVPAQGEPGRTVQPELLSEATVSELLYLPCSEECRDGQARLPGVGRGRIWPRWHPKWEAAHWLLPGHVMGAPSKWKWRLNLKSQTNKTCCPFRIDFPKRFI